MDANVAGDSSFGVEWKRIRNWELFALYFGQVDFVLKGLNMSTTDTLVADVCTTVTITSNTLRYAFPHLVSDGTGAGKEDAWSPLATRLVGRKLVMHGSVVFGWDNTTEQVVSPQTRSDMLTPMLKLLGNLVDVSTVFSSAMITSDCQFITRG